MKSPVKTTDAPAAIGPYSQAISTGSLLFVSGQLPVDPTTGTIVPGDAKAQAAQACKNAQAILKAAGTNTDSVVKTTVFITDMADFPLVNEAYKAVFTTPFPARSCFAVKALPMNALVEIELIANI
ncbi:MAG: Rid family detoxifying hydrolase [Desulfovibrionaceae bacterium]